MMLRTILLLAFFTGLQGLNAQTPATPPAPNETQVEATFSIPRFQGVNISGPTTICRGGEAMLKAEGDYEHFEWNTGATDRVIRVRESGVYEVTVTTKGGCKYTTSITVNVIPCS